MEHYRLIAIDGKPLPQHLRLLDDRHEVIGGEIAFTSEEVRFVVRLVPAHRRSAITLLKPYRRREGGDIEFPVNPHTPVEFRGGWNGEQFVLVVTMGPPHPGHSMAEAFGGDHTWHFAPDPEGELDAPPV